MLYNSSAHIEIDESGKQVAIGNVTEKGMFEYLMNSEVDAYTLQKNRDLDGFLELSIPFSSERKRQTTAVRLPSLGGKIRVYVKGAPDSVIKQCKDVEGAEGIEELSQEKKDDIIHVSVVKPLADRTYRTLLIAYADYEEAEWEELKSANNDFKDVEDRAVVEENLTAIGIFALVDPLRPGIRESVELCNRAGINVRMCTGDHIDTAIAISKEAGIVTAAELADDEEGYVAMIGKDFREATGGIRKEIVDDKAVYTVKNLKKFKEISKKLKVLARSSPDDKFLLVTGLKQEEATVAVTGDGTNDAPALNRADVGFAMGITGTDVAKNASDIILTDDNFCSIKTAIKYGRNIFDNVQKFLQFQLTVNVAAMFIVFSGAVLFSDAPLTSVQMLWMNLIMDTFAALALATEPPSDALFNRKPASRNDKIVNEVMWRNIFGQGIMQIVVLMVMLFFGQDLFSLPFESTTPFYVTSDWIAENPEDLTLVEGDATNKTYLYTMVFQSFVFMQLFNQINARKLGARDFNVFAGFFNNWIFLFITVLTFAVQVCITEFGGRALRAVPLSWEENLICLAIGSFTLIWGVIIKLILPPSLFKGLAMKEEELNDQEEAASTVANLRKSFRQSTLRRANTSTQSKKI